MLCAQVDDGDMNLDGALEGPSGGLSGFGALPSMLVQRM